VLALRPVSRAARSLALVWPHPRRLVAVRSDDLRDGGWERGPDALFALKIGAALICAALAAAIGSAGLIGPALIVVAAYAGFVAPSLAIERRARRMRDLADRRVAVLVEWIEGLVAAGRPPETAVAAVSARPTGSPVLDRALREALAAYALGAPLHSALLAAGRAVPLPSLGALAGDLERARDLGRGALTVLRELRQTLRHRERARLIEAAARVDSELMLVMVLCYLPALMLLVVIPLFATLLTGLDLVGG